MKWISSLDELLYEVMSWLLFFPLTLGRAIVRPLRTMASVKPQFLLPDEQQFSELLSPPLFLALALLLAHAIAMALGQPDEIVNNQHGLAALVDDAASALVLRVIVFASFPLFLAARFVRRSGVRLSRISLREPFYEQCFPAAVFALGISTGTNLRAAGAHWTLIGNALLVASFLYLLVVEIRWFAISGDGRHGRAAASVAIGLLEGALFVLLVGFAFTR
ncbi:hypothetical protein GCM10022280_23290 [Sphingomonas swuensis]|uniref:Yip1 domain-containing protein n=1 Tax=Sphingomonas swuensis TaxID=977800 RepID=A0ABP7T709_9SPHN